METNKSDGRSAVRVKVVLIWAIFLGCWVAFGYKGLSPGWEDALFVVAAVDVVLFYFIRCERCHDPLISLRPEKVLRLWRIMAPPKRCPKCDMERI